MRDLLGRPIIESRKYRQSTFSFDWHPSTKEPENCPEELIKAVSELYLEDDICDDWNLWAELQLQKRDYTRAQVRKALDIVKNGQYLF